MALGPHPCPRSTPSSGWGLPNSTPEPYCPLKVLTAVRTGPAPRLHPEALPCPHLTASPTPASTLTLAGRVTPTSGPLHTLPDTGCSAQLCLASCPASSPQKVTPKYPGLDRHHGRPQAVLTQPRCSSGGGDTGLGGTPPPGSSSSADAPVQPRPLALGLPIHPGPGCPVCPSQSGLLD